MADSARFIVAAEPALPWSAGGFGAASLRNRALSLASLAEGDLVASSIRSFMAQHPNGWSGLVSVLHVQLARDVPIEAKRLGQWPGNARWFSERLRRAAPALRALGIDVREHLDAHGMNVSLRRI
jgi:hypothetical protein